MTIKQLVWGKDGQPNIFLVEVGMDNMFEKRKNRPFVFEVANEGQARLNMDKLLAEIDTLSEGEADDYVMLCQMHKDTFDAIKHKIILAREERRKVKKERQDEIKQQRVVNTDKWNTIAAIVNNRIGLRERMECKDFIDAFDIQYGNIPKMSQGKLFLNYIQKYRPDLAEVIRNTEEINCAACPIRMDETIKFLEKQW